MTAGEFPIASSYPLGADVRMSQMAHLRLTSPVRATIPSPPPRAYRPSHFATASVPERTASFS